MVLIKFTINLLLELLDVCVVSLPCCRTRVFPVIWLRLVAYV